MREDEVTQVTTAGRGLRRAVEVGEKGIAGVPASAEVVDTSATPELLGTRTSPDPRHGGEHDGGDR